MRNLLQKPIMGPLCLLLLALSLRLWQLDIRPLHHDESLHAFYSHQLARTGEYKYVPFLHGPFLYFTGALGLQFMRSSDFAVRLPAAFAGALLCLLPFFLRPHLGAVGAWAAALLLTLSPTLLYYSRFLRHDIYSALLHAICLVAVMAYLQRRQFWLLGLAIAAMTASFANHELTYISLFLLGVYVLLFQRPQLLRVFSAPRRNHWMGAVAIALMIYSFFFTTFFTYMRGFVDGLPNPFSSQTSLGYWLSQHSVKRGGQPIYYYLLLLGLYEFSTVLLMIASLWPRRSDLTVSPQRKFLLFWGIGALAIYSWAGERMPWLLMHSLLPMLLLAGWRLGLAWERRQWILLGLLTPVMIFNVWVSLRLNYINHTDPHEPMVFVQSNPDVKRVAARIVEVSERLARPANVVVDNELTWPMAWYLRRQKITAYPNNLRQGIAAEYENADFILVHTLRAEEGIVLPPLFKLEGCYSLRDWWVGDWQELGPLQPGGLENLLKFWWKRTALKGFGQFYFCLLEKKFQ